MSRLASMDLDAQIKFAIANRRLIQVAYNGVARVAEPHDYGVRNGVTKLLVYQRRALSGGRTIPGWRDLDVAKIEGLTVLDEEFRGSRGPAHRQHKQWDIVYARVA